MSNQELNKEISSIIKNLNYLRQNPQLPLERLKELKDLITEATKLLQQ